MSLDRTFTDGDVIRIYERHLDPTERSAVAAYFAAEGDYEPTDVIYWANVLMARSQKRHLEAAGFIQTVEASLFDIRDVLPDKTIEEMGSTSQQLREVVDELDNLVVVIQDIVRHLPEPIRQRFYPVIDIIKALRRQVRLASAVTGLVNVPEHVEQFTSGWVFDVVDIINEMGDFREWSERKVGINPLEVDNDAEATSIG